MKDIKAFVEIRRISKGTKWIYVGNDLGYEVKGINTCKLVVMGSGQRTHSY